MNKFIEMNDSSCVRLNLTQINKYAVYQETVIIVIFNTNNTYLSYENAEECQKDLKRLDKLCLTAEIK